MRQQLQDGQTPRPPDEKATTKTLARTPDMDRGLPEGSAGAAAKAATIGAPRARQRNGEADL